MNEEIKELIIDCSNFISPYDDGGCEASRLMERINAILAEEEKALKEDALAPGEKRFHLDLSCEANGSQTLEVKAKTKEEAFEKFKKSDFDIIYEELEATAFEEVTLEGIYDAT